jgi:hypothetical protein
MPLRICGEASKTIIELVAGSRGGEGKYRKSRGVRGVRLGTICGEIGARRK